MTLEIYPFGCGGCGGACRITVCGVPLGGVLCRIAREGAGHDD